MCACVFVSFLGDEMASDGMQNFREEEDGLIIAIDSRKVDTGGDYGFENNDEEGGGLDDAVRTAFALPMK